MPELGDIRFQISRLEAHGGLMVEDERSRHPYCRAASRPQRPSRGRTIPHLSPAFLAEAVNKLDGIFGELRYQDVTAPKALIVEAGVSG